MPYSNCAVCKTRLDVPQRDVNHWKYCKDCLLERKIDKVLKAIQEFADFVKEL